MAYSLACFCGLDFIAEELTDPCPRCGTPAIGAMPRNPGSSDLKLSDGEGNTWTIHNREIADLEDAFKLPSATDGPREDS